ncbi:acyl-CoA thioesterase domain-containing protein [Rhodococcus sp. HNM0569]|uniref:acyl-CoA thioesterase domain-containing protein n=1 Tax=Rhodococcus sp. HNM0569 TaxID=2716340 RepID=UPI00146CB955|nr:acyl-CoA thioesterase domain-containing protein [Rhodococcus sp. HNM0569]NLU84753.1 thioesterase family protein [Rhodococcus sp. HNM0569]
MTSTDLRLGFFAESDGGFEPQRLARSSWGHGTLHGSAVCGLVARQLERDHGREGFVPSRLTVDIFKPVRSELTTVQTRIVRAGNRIVVADADVLQDGEVVTRATLVLLRAGEAPAGELWTKVNPVPHPPDTLGIDWSGPGAPLFSSDDGAEVWSSSMPDHQGNGRKRMWQRQLDVVVGEVSSPFVRAATVGEMTSLMTNWGSEGVGYINADLTMVVSRLPVSDDLGLEAENHFAAGGISVGSTTMYDRQGAFGTCVVTALSNARRQIDFGQDKFRVGARAAL